jgi:hypothetical protein
VIAVQASEHLGDLPAEHPQQLGHLGHGHRSAALLVHSSADLECVSLARV